MEHFKSYEIEKSKLLDKIEKLRNSISQLKDIGFENEDSIKKLEATVNAVNNDKLSIALVGSFSDGKTSVIAGWLGEKLDNMKIDSDESSDQLEIYIPKSLPEKCEIIDTPGLFGDKEKEDKNGEHIKFSDITKKYIDQANIILYVVEAKNPLKASHYEVVRWIMKDLNKIDNTIFVINKMDTVADLTDEEEFKKISDVKSDSLRNKIAEIAELSPIDSKKINIVCISSNPNDKGFDFWAEHKEAYEKRSRIKDLENKTNNILQEISSTELITKTGFDTVRRIMNEYIKHVESQLTLIIEEILPEMQENLKHNIEDFKQAKEDILLRRNSFVQDIQNYRNDLKLTLNGCTIETITDFINDKIGVENNQISGKYIVEEITKIMQEHFDYSANIISKLATEYEKVETKQNEFLADLGKCAINALGKGAGKLGAMPIGVLKDGIKVGQGFLNNVFKAGIKFKPHGITKLANNLGKAANGVAKAAPGISAGFDVIMEIIGHIKTSNNNKKFAELKNDLTKIIEGYTDDIIRIAQNSNDNYKEFLNQFAPGLADLQNYLDNQQKNIDEQQAKIEFFKKWKEQAIDVEFWEIK